MCKADYSKRVKSSIKIRSLLNNFTIKTQYEAIVSTKDESIYAYEALARFEKENKTLSSEDLLLAKRRGIDFIQGDLYKNKSILR